MKFIGYEGLKAKGLDYSRPHLWKLVKAGRLPKPVHLGHSRGRVHWIEEEIDAAIAQKIAERDEEAV